MLNFLKTPLGNAIIMMVIVGIVGVSIVLNSMDAGQQQSESFIADTTEYEYKPETTKRDIPKFKMPMAVDKPTVERVANEPETVQEAEAPKVSRPKLARQEKQKEKPKRVLPLNLYSAGSSYKPELSDSYAPYGRLIPCQTVITIESSTVDTPIIGLVTEDVYHDGRLIIPAGAEVHSRASRGRTRDRIEVSGAWNIVWRTKGELNGTEMTINGIALDMERDFNTGQWGMHDGSAGLKGYLIKSNNWNEIKLFAATFLTAANQGLKEYDEFITESGGAVQLTRSTAGNAALDGASAVLAEYANQIKEAIERDGFYIRIPPGKQFYLYVTQTIDVRDGRRGNVKNAKVWNNHEK